jgi:hypothetical protein
MYTLTVRQDSAGRLHVELDGLTLTQLLGPLLHQMVAPVSIAAPPLPPVTPPKGKPTAGHATSNGHRKRDGLVCKWCETTFAGRKGQSYCGRTCQRLANLVSKEQRSDGTRAPTATAA